MRIRQHVNPLRSEYLQIELEPLSLVPGRPMEVELGSAEAYFLMERAVEAPGQTYIGVEIRRDLVIEANELCQQNGLAQVHCVFANISVDLPRLFPPASVHRFFINFPDPWFKHRQRKRRVVGEELVDQLFDLLTLDGEIHVATDIFDIALDAMAVLEQETPRRFFNLHEPWSFLHQSLFAARSRRERLLREGRQSHLATRVSAVCKHQPRSICISSSWAMRSRSAAAFSNSSFSARLNISFLSEVMSPGISSGSTVRLPFLGNTALGGIPAVVLRRALELGDGLLNGFGRDVVLAVVFLLHGAPLAGHVDGLLHRLGFAIGIHDDLAAHVASSAAHGLNERALSAQEALLVGVEDRDQRDLRQIQSLAQKVDTHQHVEFA
jgi:tRNA (guanine-N7-)-methyltransferase